MTSAVHASNMVNSISPTGYAPVEGWPQALPLDGVRLIQEVTGSFGSYWKRSIHLDWLPSALVVYGQVALAPVGGTSAAMRSMLPKVQKELSTVVPSTDEMR